MATRSARDNKALNARHAEVLKAMLRRPENKTCADCKKNDPRWASTNLGCFMCIRCSGIHRSMGVHITRIKSIDLDTWTPEQVSNVQRWGNRRANAYWEAHLRAGHMPPDHKIESFIRSKYESRRWAMEGPIPEPETLDDDDNDNGSTDRNQNIASQAVAQTITNTTQSSKGSAPRRPSVSVTLSKSSAAPPVSTSINLLDGPPTSTRNQPAFDLNSSKPAPADGGGGGGLFDLDFSASSTAAAATATAPAARKDVKNDILSLFSNNSKQNQPPYGVLNQPQAQNNTNNFNGLNNQFGGLTLSGQASVLSNTSNAFGGFAGAATNNQGTGLGFGTSSNVSNGGMNSFGSSSNPWGNSNTSPTQQQDLFGGFVGGGSNTNSNGSTANNINSKDVFSDIWK
ncbi:putative GTPase activating protein for Arf-domain-containing protein [Phakopsora pachyrhizi]|uniref:GTPase activating protein for Arf-domain-containing protein n=1 Tax=Phakopsora pachyrhizi TaxID=170000 RepID=A0AAV0AK81_PHAPC|nr:putative GTPase activating protein for Arf-domain-containing protein [Phakopsora pachyrhizi]CAH7667440.1 putative GTPase activating protein for Arf-domain-containing protein [Phakopsora pachyrhizi]CAH7672170.1 putative GTPase activating protein for Arf-domain-containing protein [Phakopsora pachyrhizi]